MTLYSEHRKHFDQPTSENVKELLDDLDAGTTTFVSLMRTKQEFLQVAKSHANGYLMEYRDGLPTPLYRSLRHDFTTMEVEEAFMAYLQHNNSWISKYQWEIAQPAEQKDYIALISKLSWIPALLILAVIYFMWREQSGTVRHLIILMTLLTLFLSLTTINDIRKWKYLDPNYKFRIGATLFGFFIFLICSLMELFLP